ncbi:MAG TPA: hypothetical protein PKD64_18195 [Pirellulaceae bacterium]|nr:hypothetical protein [Pirellulaceae bacterium]HMO94120.1 hypothetical protein [Pirellulaceae bacterium]HMP70836.1 hypothetical protein [Pirellulaceae bacterium]
MTSLTNDRAKEKFEREAKFWLVSIALLALIFSVGLFHRIGGFYQREPDVIATPQALRIAADDVADSWYESRREARRTIISENRSTKRLLSKSANENRFVGNVAQPITSPDGHRLANLPPDAEPFRGTGSESKLTQHQSPSSPMEFPQAASVAGQTGRTSLPENTFDHIEPKVQQPSSVADVNSPNLSAEIVREVEKDPISPLGQPHSETHLVDTERRSTPSQDELATDPNSSQQFAFDRPSAFRPRETSSLPFGEQLPRPVDERSELEFGKNKPKSTTTNPPLPNATRIPEAAKKTSLLPDERGNNNDVATASFDHAMAEATQSIGNSNHYSLVARHGDTLWSIAMRVYGDGRLFRALSAVNRDRLGEQVILEKGTLILTPPLNALIEKYPGLVPQDIRELHAKSDEK